MLISGTDFISFAEKMIFLVKENPSFGLKATIFSLLDKSVSIFKKIFV